MDLANYSGRYTAVEGAMYGKSCKAFVTNCTGESFLSMEGSDVLSYLGIFAKCFITVLAGEDSIFFMIIDMILQA